MFGKFRCDFSNHWNLEVLGCARDVIDERFRFDYYSRFVRWRTGAVFTFFKRVVWPRSERLGRRVRSEIQG